MDEGRVVTKDAEGWEAAERREGKEGREGKVSWTAENWRRKEESERARRRKVA